MITLKNLILASFLIIHIAAFSQLGNVNTQQVGTEGLLMGGSLVAAESNNSGLFYNPASISSNSLFSFSFNTSVFRIQFLNFKNAFGPETAFKLSSSRFESPFFSMMLPTKNKYDVKFGFGTFSRFNVDYNFFDRILVKNPFPELNHKDAIYDGTFSYTLKSSEQWIVFDASKRISEKVLLGSSVIIAIRSFTYVTKEDAGYTFYDELINKSSSARLSNETNAYLSDYKLLFKFGGIFIFNEKNRVGLTVTTPSISVITSGRNFRSIQQSNIGLLVDEDQQDEFEDIKVSNFASGLNGKYKTPFSIALGYDWHIEKHLFSISAEYVGAIKIYNLIEGGDNVDELINTESSRIDVGSFLDLIFGQRAIVNFSVGYKSQVSEKFMLMGGFRTNFSTTKNVDYSGISEVLSVQDLEIDQYHLSGGVTFTLFRNKFILGTDLGLSFDKNNNNLINFSNPEVINNNGIPLRGNIEPIMKQTIVSIGFVFGYSFNF